jgi:glutamate-1-semialdehyde aminotransferase
MPSVGSGSIADWCPHPAIHPKTVTRRFKARLVDQYGTEWIDFLSGWGSNILGFDHPPVLSSVKKQLDSGIGTGVRTEAYDRVERQLLEHIPCAEQVAFGKNGSDATAGAARLARAVTGRNRVLVRGYHGFHDWYLASDPSTPGIPRSLSKAVGQLPVDDLVALEALLEQQDHDIAAVMIDPASIPLPEPEELRGVVELCRQSGVVAIFDEVVSGFRFALGGAQELYGLSPDLACFSKAMANGFPLSALVGSSELMASLPSTRFGMTFGSEVVSLAAAAATIAEIRDREVCSSLIRKGRYVAALLSEAAAHASVRIEIVGHDSRPQILFVPDRGPSEREMRWLFLQELARLRVQSTGIFLMSAAHTDEDLDLLGQAVHTAMTRVGQALDRASVEGMLEPVLLAGVRAADLPIPAVQPREAGDCRDTNFTIDIPGAIRSAVRSVVPGYVIQRLGPALRRPSAPPDPAPVIDHSLADLFARTPENFDWRVYLQRYPDLVESGIDSEIEAVRHYVLYGASEGRWGTPDSRVARLAMRCPAMDSMFVRAWGALSCWDDAGARSTPPRRGGLARRLEPSGPEPIADLAGVSSCHDSPRRNSQASGPRWRNRCRCPACVLVDQPRDTVIVRSLAPRDAVAAELRRILRADDAAPERVESSTTPGFKGAHLLYRTQRRPVVLHETACLDLAATRDVHRLERLEAINRVIRPCESEAVADVLDRVLVADVAAVPVAVGRDDGLASLHGGRDGGEWLGVILLSRSRVHSGPSTRAAWNRRPADGPLAQGGCSLRFSWHGLEGETRVFKPFLMPQSQTDN